jgi:hypothetical protein
MIIGTNFEFCLSDILLGNVSYKDIYVIICNGNVDFSDMGQVTNWWDRQMDPWTQHLSRGKNSLNLHDFEDVYQHILVLIDEGKLVFRGEVLPTKIVDLLYKSNGEHWFELNLREKDMEPAVKLAWDHYRMLAGLCK